MAIENLIEWIWAPILALVLGVAGIMYRHKQIDDERFTQTSTRLAILERLEEHRSRDRQELINRMESLEKKLDRLLERVK